MLVIAQLSITLHAAEHGVGQHAHDGVPCLYGATNDDDVLGSPPSVVIPKRIDTHSDELTAAEQVIDVSETGARLPPATGPPNFS